MGVGEGLGHIVAAKVVTGELGTRVGLSDRELATVMGVLAAGAHGWRAFECETLDADGTYVGTIRITTHPAVTRRGKIPDAISARDPGEEDAAPGAAARRARPKTTPAQTRIRAALSRGASDPERRESDPERLENPAASGETPNVSSV